MIMSLQAFVRDPDGYYIEFANCSTLDEFIHAKMEENEKNWSVGKTKSVLTVSKQLKKFADLSKKSLVTNLTESESLNLVIS